MCHILHQRSAPRPPHPTDTMHLPTFSYNLTLPLLTTRLHQSDEHTGMEHTLLHISHLIILRTLLNVSICVT